MADDDIKITITADDKASASLRAVGASAENLSRKTESARLATWGLGEAAENAAQSLGIPNQMSRELGTSVENLAGRLGGAALAFGAVGLAAMAVYGIYKFVVDRQKRMAEEAHKLAEAKKKVREQIEQAGKASADWLSQADKHIKKTKEMRDADYALYEVQFRRNKDTLNNAILDKQQHLNDLLAQREKVALRILALAKSGVSGAASGAMAENIALSKEIEYQRAELASMQARLEGSQAMTAAQFGSGGPKDNKPKRSSDDYFNQVLAAEAAYAEGSLALARARGDSMASIHQAETEAFDAAAAARYATMQGEEQQRDFLAQNEMRRQVMLLEQARAIEAQKQAMQKQTADNFIQTAALMASAGGKNARKWFSLQKNASIAQAIMNTYEGATKALSQGGVWGAVLAASIVALGMAQVAKIRSQEFEGGAGAMGGGVGTYNVNPGTGLPQQPPQQQAAPAFTLIINGKPVDVAQVMKDGVQYLYDNNGSTGGGLSVQVARSA